MNTRFWSRIAALSTVLSAAALGHSLVAYSSLAPSDGYLGSGWTISGPNSGVGTQSFAMQFTSLESGILDNVRVAIGNVSGDNSAMLNLYEDSGSDTIGSFITGWGFGPLPDFGAGSGIVTLNNAFPSIVLSQGSKYWVECNVISGDTWNAWNFADHGSTSVSGFSTDGGTTYNYGVFDESAYEVNVRAVPEPATLAVLGIGVLAARRRRNR